MKDWKTTLAGFFPSIVAIVCMKLGMSIDQVIALLGASTIVPFTLAADSKKTKKAEVITPEVVQPK